MTPIRERAAAFERDHASKEIFAGPHRWHYYSGGHGQTVLLLAGGAGIAIGWLDLALVLRPRFRTIAVDYPRTVASFDDLAEGVLAILDAEGAVKKDTRAQSTPTRACSIWPAGSTSSTLNQRGRGPRSSSKRTTTRSSRRPTPVVLSACIPVAGSACSPTEVTRCGSPARRSTSPW
ncbi:hypothetical protein WMF30_38010 [Sorangium sp. So ce134]